MLKRPVRILDQKVQRLINTSVFHDGDQNKATHRGSFGVDAIGGVSQWKIGRAFRLS
jgi:hypothetical protein